MCIFGSTPTPAPPPMPSPPPEPPRMSDPAVQQARNDTAAGARGAGMGSTRLTLDLGGQGAGGAKKAGGV